MDLLNENIDWKLPAKCAHSATINIQVHVRRFCLFNKTTKSDALPPSLFFYALLTVREEAEGGYVQCESHVWNLYYDNKLQISHRQLYISLAPTSSLLSVVDHLQCPVSQRPWNNASQTCMQSHCWSQIR